MWRHSDTWMQLFYFFRIASIFSSFLFQSFSLFLVSSFRPNSSWKITPTRRARRRRKGIGWSKRGAFSSRRGCGRRRRGVAVGGRLLWSENIFNRRKKRWGGGFELDQKWSSSLENNRTYFYEFFLKGQQPWFKIEVNEDPFIIKIEMKRA